MQIVQGELTRGFSANSLEVKKDVPLEVRVLDGQESTQVFKWAFSVQSVPVCSKFADSTSEAMSIEYLHVHRVCV